MGAEKIPEKMGRKISLGTKIGVGLNLAFAYSDYKDARKEGSGVVGSMAHAAGTYALGEALGLWMIPLSIASSVPEMTVGAMEGIGKYQRQMNKQARRIPFNNATFNDYKQAYTMRQAGMQLAQNSQYNLQQTLLGNEASYLR